MTDARIVARDVMVGEPAATVTVNLPPDHCLTEAEQARLAEVDGDSFTMESRFADFADAEWEAAVASPETIIHGRDDEIGTVWRVLKADE